MKNLRTYGIPREIESRIISNYQGLEDFISNGNKSLREELQSKISYPLTESINLYIKGDRIRLDVDGVEDFDFAVEIKTLQDIAVVTVFEVYPY